jgi:hypothetical protein
MASPVWKAINVDVLPERTALYKANTSALAQYTDINEEARLYVAVDRKEFVDIKKEVAVLESNDVDSSISLELWKYDPGILVGDHKDRSTVDPLSLYLSLKDSQDERIAKALDKILGDIQW